MATGVRCLALRFTIPAAALAAMVALALLFKFEPESYYQVLAFVGIHPNRYPFSDFQGVLASVDGWQHGIDVYEGVLAFDFPPLWLRFAFLPGPEWTNPVGLCLAVSFFVALAVLPPPRSAKELLPRLVATLSPVTALAVERANTDLLMFLIAAAAGVLLLGPLRRRAAGYAMIIIAGLLKIYPLVLMVLTLRERPRVFLLVNGAAAAMVLATGVYFHGELVKILLLQSIPTSGPFSSAFGAHYLPDVIAGMVGMLHPGFPLRLVRLAIFVSLFLAMAGWFFCIVRWRDWRSALTRLPESEKMFLLIGAALIAGCFFAGTNIGYRGIHLLFTLPGLLAMARMEDDIRVRRMAVQGCVLVVALTWAGFFMLEGLFRPILASGIGKLPSAVVVGLLWLLSQIAWWQVATLFIAILIGCCSTWLEAAMPLRIKALSNILGRLQAATPGRIRDKPSHII
jgi:hypothetical protein